MNIGQIIKDRYKILELLGEGGMAFVYKAEDKQLKRTVAIKTLKPNIQILFKFLIGELKVNHFLLWNTLRAILLHQ